MNKRALTIIFVTVFIDLLGFGIVIPLLPLYAERFGASPTVIGWLLASYLIAQAIAAPLLGKLSDRIGRRPVLIASLAGSAISFTLLGLAETLPWLFVARVLAGLAGGSVSAAKSYIADVTTPENRAKGMGFLGAGIALGYVFGPALGGLLTHWQVTLPYFVAGATALLNCFSAMLFLPAPPRSDLHAIEEEDLQPLVKARRLLVQPGLRGYLWMVFLITLSFSLFTGTFALLCQHQFRYTPAHIGALLSFVGLMAALVQGGLIGPLVKKFRELPLATVGSAMFAAGLGLVPLAHGTGLMLAALFLIGFGNSLNMPTLLALVSREAAASEQGRVLGVQQSLESVARIIGLVLGGWLFAHAEWMPYAGGAALMTLATGFALSHFVAGRAARVPATK
ncbi:MAG: MFS transporter [Verrucomicrobia bacterium]|nr:MFS transporter [Verrucomicrobiota bacterium]